MEYFKKNKLYKFVALGALIMFTYIATANLAKAGNLTTLRDTLSTPAPSTASDHTIIFTTASAITASGHISITPRAGYFTIPASLDYRDIDVQVNSTNISLAATAGSGIGAAWGVAVTSGTSGSVTLTLNDTDSVAGNSSIEIKIGTNANFGTTGTNQITNPVTTGSYVVDINTSTNTNSEIDTGAYALAIVEPVGVSGDVSSTPTPTATPTPAPTTPSSGGSGGGYLPPAPSVPKFPISNPCDFPPADLNCDKKVNAKDFSILMYYWQKQGTNIRADINKDSTVNLLDFAIMMYWWNK